MLEEPAVGCPGPGFFAQRPDAAVQAQQVDLVWQAIGQGNRWDVFQAENRNFDPDHWMVAAVSDDHDSVTAYVPGATLKGNTLNVLWADDADPAWKVRGSRAPAPGAVSSENAFLPDVVAKDSFVVYAAYSRVNDTTDDCDIHWNRSDDGGVSWAGEVSLVVTPATPSLFPSVTWDGQGQHAWAVWREGNGPNWTIQGQQVE